MKLKCKCKTYDIIKRNAYGGIMTIREDAKKIIDEALKSALPDTAVKKALKKLEVSGGKLVLVALGKAAWQMAKTAKDVLGDMIDDGIVITKYGHISGEIKNIRCFEAGHPVPDDNSFKATSEAIDLVKNLGEKDTVLLLISGGGSALFEQPHISMEELQDITTQLLASGADIVEINTIRKRLSKVKGGKFAKICAPAKVFSIVLSDIIGDPLDMIASGPAYPDSSTCADARNIIEKYNINLSDVADLLINIETPKELDNVETYISGSVKQLCNTAIDISKELGYEPIFLTSSLSCTAKDAGSFLASIARDNANTDKSLAFIAGGETVVQLTGNGKGGRNQEIALSAALGISGLEDILIFSVGSDGTDGPTDAAGGMVDGNSEIILNKMGIDISKVLKNNDAYNALKQCDGLIITGPTGTNVNDLTVVLIKR